MTPDSTAAAVNERLAAITAAGTSVWLDQIRRSLVDTGELARLVREDSLRGLTSNPAIFEKAILGSPEYDEQIEELARAGADARAVYRAIATRDVQEAADVLRVVWDESGGADGFVSLEVDPDLAHKTDLTLTQAREYWAEVDRPNLMIKIPGTDAGLPAIEEAIYEGINVNVTLLFAVESYATVAEAYLKGLERRHAEGKSLDVHSVASFFVSRVDTEVDKRLEKLGREDLNGRAGLANARAAYKRFREIFESDRFRVLEEAGASVQRPLWASTGVKNPAYPDTLYVDGLVGPHTVNTMPMATLIAAAEQSEVQADTNNCDIDPTEDLKALADAGIDIDDVTKQLLSDGIDAFVTPMEKLLAGIEEKREGIVTRRPPTVAASLPDELEPAIIARLDEAEKAHVARRIWKKDPTLWGEAGQPELADRLGWLTIADRLSEAADDLMGFAQACKGDGFTDAVLLGMGGSSLAPEVIRRSFADAGGLRLHVLDSTDAAAVAAVEAEIELSKTLFIVSSKSGGTIETRSQLDYFWDKAGHPAHYVAITDPGSGLADLAQERGFRRVFLNDPDIGGRYSALSYFGLVPAALMGVDLGKLLHRAGVAAEACTAYDTSQGNSGLWLGVILGELASKGRDKLTFVVDEPIGSFGLWVEQLVAESTGKEGRGALPVADEPLGAPEVYGDDRVFVHLRSGEDRDKEIAALVEAGHPVIKLDVEGPEDLGRIFFIAEFATAVAGWVLRINPFDQPNVQQAKDATARVLEEGLPDIAEAGDDELHALLGTAGPPDYVAILGYVAPSEEMDAAIAELRTVIRDHTRSATTFGYGPRYLHSTGQLHKGGPATGRFLQLLHPVAADLEIAGRDYSFETLKAAQAAGDLQTLRDHGRAAERVLLTGDDPVAGVHALIARIKEILS